MATREQRQKAIEKLEKVLSDANGIYLTDYSGIDVSKITKLRRGMRESGAKYLVVKNKLAQIALERCGKAELVGHLKGPVGVAVAGEDTIGPARVIKDFKKEFKELLGLKVAYIDGALFNESQAAALADLPSREVLLAQLLSVMQAPIANFAGTLNGIFTKLLGTIEAVRTKKESEGQ